MREILVVDFFVEPINTKTVDSFRGNFAGFKCFWIPNRRLKPFCLPTATL
nr:MAG TPA: hypothetical protein [Caudoviricetes sp.]